MSLWVSKNNNERVTTKEHLADESILVHRFFFPFPVFGACRNKKICHCQAKTNANKRSRLTPTESTQLKMTDNGDLLTSI
jgi:hypothetical protein